MSSPDTPLEHSVAVSLATANELVRVIEPLQSRGLDVLVLKGPALALVARRALIRRSSRDLDLLVRPGDVPPVTRSLVEIGYSFAPGAFPDAAARILGGRLIKPGHTPIDLHVTVHPHGLTSSLDAASIWERCISVEIGGTGVRTLCPQDYLTYLSVHGCLHRWERQQWIDDIAALIRRYPNLDWDAIESRARKGGVYRMLLTALRLSRDVAGVAPPDRFTADIESRRIASLAQSAVRYLENAPNNPKVGLRRTARILPFHLASLDRLRDRVRYVLTLVVAPTPGDVCWVTLPDRLFPLYYVLRPIRLAWQYLLHPIVRLERSRFNTAPPIRGRLRSSESA